MEYYNNHKSPKYIGNIGEKLALNYFIKNKKLILRDKNVYFKGGEIDLVMEDGDFLVFIEVKTVTEDSSLNSIDNFSAKKAKNMKRAIEIYLYKNKLLNYKLRIDLACITLKKIFFMKTQIERSDFDIQIVENIILE